MNNVRPILSTTKMGIHFHFNSDQGRMTGDKCHLRPHSLRGVQAMRLLRVTVRRLMVAVAVVALAFPLSRMALFYFRCWNAALFHAEQEKYYALQLKNLAFDVYEPSVTSKRRQEMMKESESKARRLSQYHAEMKSKYEQAATHPWDSLEPDPPEPK